MESCQGRLGTQKFPGRDNLRGVVADEMVLHKDRGIGEGTAAPGAGRGATYDGHVLGGA